MIKAGLFAAALTVVTLPAGFSAREKTAARRINAPTLAAHVRFLADDLLEGRGPASRGGELAMRYIATEMERLGLEPAGDDGGWLQHFDIVGLTGHVVSPPTFTGAGGKTMALKPGVDSVIAPGVQSDAQSVSNADVVFAGYGITAPEQKWDDYAGLDVHGKIVMVMNNDPEDDPKLFAGKTRLYYGRWTYKYEEAARHGAAGVIIVHTEHSAGYPWQVVQTSWGGEQFELPSEGEPRVQLKMWATEDASRALVKLGGRDLDELRKAANQRGFKAVPLQLKMSAALKATQQRVRTANVLGRLPGSDDKLKSEYVVVSAHHDHLGKHGDPHKDDIFNGALDNASGVAALLNLADAMTAVTPHPKRTILFAAVGGEESGLLGSSYFAAHPVVAPGKIAANVNIDEINIWGRSKDIGVIGYGKSSLDDVVASIAKAQGRSVAPDDEPDKGGFYRSDQFSFAKIGVPAIYLKPGILYPGHDAAWGKQMEEKYTKERYHQPSDQIDASWNLEGAVEDVQLMAVALLRVADAPKMPEWRPGDEFEAVRKQAEAKAK